MGGTIIFLIILILLVAILFSCIKIVPQPYAYVVEIFGSYRDTWEHGLHFKIPFIERIAGKVSLKEQVCDFPPSSVITKDNVSMKIDTVVYFKVFDPKLYVYGVDRPISALENLNATTLRNIIGGLELDQTLTSRDAVNSQMQVTLDKATDAWGIKVFRVELKNIIPPEEIQKAMEKQMKAEREKRERILEAEAHRESVITKAEGDKQAKILRAEADRDAEIARAEGRARSIELVAEAEARGIEAIKNAGADETVLRLKGYEAMGKVADGRATKIYLPPMSDFSSAIMEGNLFGEGFKDASAEIDMNPKAPAPVEEDDCCEESVEQSIIDNEAEIGEEYPIK